MGPAVRTDAPERPGCEQSIGDSGEAPVRRDHDVKHPAVLSNGLRGAALAFPVCAGRHSNHDNGRCSDRNRCLPAGRLLLRSVAALRGQPEVSEGTGQRCRERCMESTQEPDADRSCHRGRVLPVESPGALTRIKVRHHRAHGGDCPAEHALFVLAKVTRGRWGRSLVRGGRSEAFPAARVAGLVCCTAPCPNRHGSDRNRGLRA